jgi:hypothetical protein
VHPEEESPRQVRQYILWLRQKEGAAVTATHGSLQSSDNKYSAKRNASRAITVPVQSGKKSGAGICDVIASSLFRENVVQRELSADQKEGLREQGV